jgi:hypothetical protein
MPLFVPIHLYENTILSIIIYEYIGLKLGDLLDVALSRGEDRKDFYVFKGL